MRWALDVSLLVATAISTSPEPFPCCSEACDRPGHDPSALQRTDDGFYVTLVTGSGAGEAFGMKYLDPADYSAGWRQGDDSFLVPSWLLDYEPWRSAGCGDGKTSACPFWAPDIPTSGNGIMAGGDDFIMYYSVPALDNEGSGCIGRATGRFHGPQHQDDRAFIDWEEAGEPVVCGNVSSARQGGPHTIDPSVSVGADGRWWLTYGSWSSSGPHGGGIWAVELDPTTGLLGSEAREACGDDFPYCWSRQNTAFKNVANNPQISGQYDDTNSIEASYLYAGDKLFYLFVNYYWCCRGMGSTYEIRVGRSSSPTGPFVDRDGVDMVNGGGELVLENVTSSESHTMVGPGHAGIMRDENGQFVFTFDYMAVDSDDNQWYQTQARVLHWQNGWPIVQPENFLPTADVAI